MDIVSILKLEQIINNKLYDYKIINENNMEEVNKMLQLKIDRKTNEIL
jgi:hypothetical protein